MLVWEDEVKSNSEQAPSAAGCGITADSIGAAAAAAGSRGADMDALRGAELGACSELLLTSSSQTSM